ncbi:N-glycanase, partial [bacterium]|nr:N-glycanase [bacterium]
FSRSGWGPGDAVSPTVINLDLEPGTHDLKLLIEDIRPEKDGHYGYWRVSAIMVGWN